MCVEGVEKIFKSPWKRARVKCMCHIMREGDVIISYYLASILGTVSEKRDTICLVVVSVDVWVDLHNGKAFLQPLIEKLKTKLKLQPKGAETHPVKLPKCTLSTELSSIL